MGPSKMCVSFGPHPSGSIRRGHLNRLLIVLSRTLLATGQGTWKMEYDGMTWNIGTMPKKIVIYSNIQYYTYYTVLESLKIVDIHWYVMIWYVSSMGFAKKQCFLHVIPCLRKGWNHGISTIHLQRLPGHVPPYQRLDAITTILFIWHRLGYVSSHHQISSICTSSSKHKQESSAYSY